MPTQSRDSRTRAQLLVNAYVESLVGLFALRLSDVKSAVRAHAAEMTIMSSFEGEHVNLDARRVVDDLSTSGAEIITAVEQTTGAFVTAMWDLLNSHERYEKIASAPDVQFFRHLRNACGHDGRWSFKEKELVRRASWRDKSLTMADVGTPVFQKVLKHGDVMLIFLDLDRKYFQS